MSTRDVRLTMADGVELAATLYLPADGTPQPCLLEALPYRKDDLTASYSAGYERLRDEFGYAVCRLDVRGTGSSAGDATDEYPAAEQPDLAELIAWLADQPWCDGNVGMWGTAYSGFSSLQLACERPPALKAVCAIYASDDRWTDDLHWRGGALRLVDLVDYCRYMTPMTLLPSVPAVWGEGWREEWHRRLDIQEPWVLTWLRERTRAVGWTVTDDVLRRSTTCAVRHGSGYATPHGGHACESYAGEVVVDRRSFAQSASAECTYRLTWPGVDVRVTSTMRVDVGAAGYDVTIAASAYDGDELVTRRHWSEHVSR